MPDKLFPARHQGGSWGVRLRARYAAPDGLGLTTELNVHAGMTPDTPGWESEDSHAQPANARLKLRAGYGLLMAGAHWTAYGETRLGRDG